MTDKTLQKGHGFIPDQQNPEDYVFGAGQIVQDPLQEGGQWDDFLPEVELQKRNGVETYNCTAYGTLNCIEILIERIYGIEENFSERYVGIVAGTKYPGNSPHKVIESIRKQSGLIDEAELPFHDAIQNEEEYYSPRPMTNNLLVRGREWLDRYLIKHEWVFTGGDIKQKQSLLKSALTFSPIGVSVHAWRERNGLYVKDGQPDNHWCTLYGYEEGKYWKIFDHYNNTLKKLDWNYDFGYAKRYFVERKTVNTVQHTNWVTELLSNLFEFFTSFFRKTI